jgi:hypothetical protein
MGDVNTARQIAPLAIAAVLSTAMAKALAAPANLDADRPALSGELDLRLLVNMAAVPYEWSRRCGIGDPERWTRAVAAIDRRLQHCAGRHSEWQAQITSALEKARRDAPVRSASMGLAELIFWKLVEQHQRTPLDTDKVCAEFRASPVSMDVLAPGSVPEKERQAAWQVEREREKPPTTYCEWGCPRAMLEIRQLGDDERWIEAPCANLVPQ